MKKNLHQSAVLLILCILINSISLSKLTAQTHVVPTAYLSTAGTASFLGPLANAPRTYQLLINESELTSVIGQNIEGLTFRIPVSATADWPSSEAVFSSYDIYLSGSVAPMDRSLTFINNVVGVQKQVRSGSLTIPVNSFTFGGNPNAFGYKISFGSIYLYTGGHLLIEIRHTGFSGTSRSVDAIGTSISGYGTLFSACWTGNYTGTSGSQGNFAVTSLSVSGPLGIGSNLEMPGKYGLSQNFPNPFNPNTKINFQIPELSHVQLKVYDLSGKEISVLVNETKSAGSYFIDFDGAGLSSGIYFYTLITGNYSETKIMTLMK